MTLLVLGLNHHVAPVEVRERLALRGGIGQLWPRLADRCAEGVLLATCNRLELYALAEDAAAARGLATAALADHAGLGPDALGRLLYTHHDTAAARHLLRVACGLDSMIVGEGQILGQVRDALAAAAAAGVAGPALSALFRQAVTAGKRARTETGIAQSAASVSHAAVQLARRVFGDLGESIALVVGAGKMAELAARQLLAHGCPRLVVANRTPARAQDLAARFGGEAVPLAAIETVLAGCDIVVTSTGAPEPILRAETVRRAARARRGRPLFLIDIAVPRDVEPEAGSLENVFLYNIDDLQALVASNLERRRQEIARVEAIVDEELGRFVHWWAAREVAPTIAALRERAEAIRAAELARVAPRLNDLTEREWEAVAALTRGIVNKLLHDPVVRLKLQAGAAGAGRNYSRIVRDLFALDGEPTP